MNQKFSNKNKFEFLPSNSNTVFLQNSDQHSLDGFEFADNDNFWTVDPLLLIDQYRSNEEHNSNEFRNHQRRTKSENRNFSEQTLRVLSQRDEATNAVKTEEKETEEIRKKYIRKLPLHFVDTADWQLYLDYAAIRDAPTTPLTKIGRGIFTKYSRSKSKKVQRLLNSIYNLYHEYSLLNKEYELLRKSYLDKCNHLESMSADEHDELTKDTLKQPNVNKSSQTNPVSDWSELVKVISNGDSVINTMNHSRKTKCGTTTSIASKRNTVSLSSEASTTFSKIKRTKIYDHLTRQSFLGQQSIDIVEELQTNHTFIAHKMHITNTVSDLSPSSNSSSEASQNDFLNHPNFIFNSIATALRCATSKTNSDMKAINLPILLDLVLPKVQLKIHAIFVECPFLSNVLEVMAELRSRNYSKKATVDYFVATQQLRGSIREFVASDLDDLSRSTVLQCLQREDNVADSSVELAAMQAEKAIIEIMSKSTDIEPGIFDHSVQDSFSQTLTGHVKRHPSRIVDCARDILRNVAYLKRSVKESKVQVAHLRRQVSSLIKALKNNIELIMSLSSKQFMSDQHRGRIMLLVRQVEELKLKLKDEETKRRSVYNLMQEQMGNVRVYCRCRDIPNNENVLDIQSNESIVLPVLSQERFDFDSVFPSNMKQSDIYDEFKPLVMSFIDGFNVCFITYGSEASGKTYTLIGGNLTNDEEHGIMQRALNTVLHEQRSRNRDWNYKISACLIEIYNDNCRDILSGDNGIQLYVECGMESVYQKLKSLPVTSEADVDVLLHLCRSKRKVAKTALNPASSRSHLITLIRLQGKSKIHGEKIRSFMCLCDLAGFEDIIKAETQSNKTLATEAGYINKSLTAFNRVFVSLRRQDPNTVCYRDTKLTHLLKPFLTNSGKCALIITIRTDRRSLSSTQNTLRFGRETRGVSLGKARRQVNNNK